MEKVKTGYVIREISGSYYVISSGSANQSGFHGVIRLNSTGVFLWNRLEKGADEDSLASALVSAYDVDKSTALQDSGEFLSSLRSVGIIEPV